MHKQCTCMVVHFKLVQNRPRLLWRKCWGLSLSELCAWCDTDTMSHTVESYVLSTSWMVIHHIFLTTILPVRASPEIWLGARGHIDLNSLGTDPSVCIFCNFPLKLFTETAETDSTSNAFQRLITHSVKTCWRKSARTLLLCNSNECPLALELWENSKKVWKLTGSSKIQVEQREDF